jgi:hypothetical protein
VSVTDSIACHCYFENIFTENVHLRSLLFAKHQERSWIPSCAGCMPRKIINKSKADLLIGIFIQNLICIFILNPFKPLTVFLHFKMGEENSDIETQSTVEA